MNDSSDMYPQRQCSSIFSYQYCFCYDKNLKKIIKSSFSCQSIIFLDSNDIKILISYTMSKYKKPVELSIPQSYQLGFCTISTPSQHPFTIFNPNAKALPYTFKFTQFTITPSKGVLLPNSYSNFKIEFVPKEASVTVGTVILEVQGESQRVIKMSAVGKYPYLSANLCEIDFGHVLVTKTVTRELVIKNNSEVPAEFHIESVGGDGEFDQTFFGFTPDRGTIPPRMSFAVRISFTPGFADTRIIANFKIICQNGNEIPLHLKGLSRRFNVNFNTPSINFGQIKLQNSCTKVLTITNNSQLNTEYEFFTDASNVFMFNETKGILPRSSYIKIIIEFRPRNTVTYYERVYCLIRNHSLLYIDLIGTCYDLLIRPIPLIQQHVDTFRKRVIEGRISAIELKYIENNLLLKLAKRGLEDSHEQNFYLTNMQVREHPYVLQKQLFLQGDQNQLISISNDMLDFGYSQILTISGQKEIDITNKMQCRLSLNWITQKRQNLNGEYMTVFQVFPQSAVLKPNVPVRFNISFRPLKGNNYYFQHLQFFASKQSTKISKKTLEEFEYRELKAKPQSTLLRNVKLTQTIQSKVKEDVETIEVLPPIAGSVRCVGHSFGPSSMPFIPILKIIPPKVTFKPCLKGHSVYDSVELINQSDTPVFFKISPDPHKVFRAYPRIGLIQPKAFSIVALEFNPRQYKTYKSNLSISLNDLPGANAKLSLTGICTQPQLKLQNNGKIFFAPTFTGVCTKKTFTIENLSKTKVTYRINVPQKYQEQLNFQPMEKELDANESFALKVFFAPSQKRHYKIRIPVEAVEDIIPHNLELGYHNPGSAISQNGQSDQSIKKFNIEVNGQGADGSIQVNHEEINFNTVKIGEQKKMSVILKNSSSCAFFVDLQFKNNKFQDSYENPTQTQILSSFSTEFKQGIIPANSEITVGIIFSPTEVFNYDLKLAVSAREKIPNSTGLKGRGEACQKCDVRLIAEGNYPLMEVIDIRNDKLSVAALWENFQIAKLNQELGCRLDSSQKKYLSVQTLTFIQAKALEDNLKHYDWNLGYVSAKNKARPRKVLITVKNVGGTPLDYSFKFPSDNKVDEQLWADPGEPTEEQAYEKAILEYNIFQIKPKKCRLQPGQIKEIQLIYSPVQIQGVKQGSSQIHYLKVVFQIDGGKSLVFTLKGTTLGPNQGLLTVKKTQYQLPSTPIGLLTPLRFPIELNNVGSIKVNYKTQVSYCQDQFQQVFKIQNPGHFLLAGQNHYLYCLYKPLIAKTYNFKIFLHVYDFNKQIQTIELNVKGRGLSQGKGANNKTNRPVIGQRNTISQIGSKVFFSIEDIDFEDLQPEQTKYRLVILYNMSKDHSLNFDFPTESAMTTNRQGLTCGDKFTIEPFQGTLEPTKFIQLKITLSAALSPSFYQGQIPCHITWSSNKYSTEDNDLTQKDVLMTAQKQSLFLRIRKAPKLNCKQNNVIIPVLKDPKKSLFDHVFESIFSSALNDPEIEDLVSKLQKEECPIAELMSSSLPIGIGCQPSDPSQQADTKRDYSNHEWLLLNEQFQDLTEIVMQNTFFNIIQETTHQENDFLRVGKKFIQANKL